MSQKGDQAFRAEGHNESWPEMTYGGAVSFLRRKYTRDLQNVDLVVSGVPFDSAVTYRPGCRLGPRGIRAASVQLQELKMFPYGFNPFEKLSIIDYGDAYIDPHHPDGVTEQIANHAREILKSNAKMLTMGGDHYVAYPLLKAHAEKYGPIALIQFDAHCDTWPDDPARLDHGSMFLRAVETGIVSAEHSTQIGIRTQNDSTHGFEILTSPWIHRNGIDAAMEIAKARAKDMPVYISFDIDVLDPAFAPGTGTPVAGGLASWQVLEMMRALYGLNLIGMDLVEVSPPFDHAEITALAGAHIMAEFVNLLAKAKGSEEHMIGKV